MIRKRIKLEPLIIITRKVNRNQKTNLRWQKILIGDFNHNILDKNKNTFKTCWYTITLFIFGSISTGFFDFLFVLFLLFTRQAMFLQRRKAYLGHYCSTKLLAIMQFHGFAIASSCALIFLETIAYYKFILLWWFSSSAPPRLLQGFF